MIIVLCCVGYFIGVVLTTLLCSTKIDITNNDDRLMFCWLWVIGIPIWVAHWIALLPERLYYKWSK